MYWIIYQSPSRGKHPSTLSTKEKANFNLQQVINKRNPQPMFYLIDGIRHCDLKWSFFSADYDAKKIFSLSNFFLKSIKMLLNDLKRKQGSSKLLLRRCRTNNFNWDTCSWKGQLEKSWKVLSFCLSWISLAKLEGTKRSWKFSSKVGRVLLKLESFAAVGKFWPELESLNELELSGKFNVILKFFFLKFSSRKPLYCLKRHISVLL